MSLDTNLPATPEKPSVGFIPLIWWGFFGVATVSMSLALQSFKQFTLNPTLPLGFKFAVACLACLLSVTILIYDGYVKEKQLGKIQRPFAPFEWLFAQQYPQLAQRPPNLH